MVKYTKWMFNQIRLDLIKSNLRLNYYNIKIKIKENSEYCTKHTKHTK